MVKSFEKLISLENIFSAWREFRAGKNNRPDIMAFERNLEDNLFALREDLVNHIYKHGPYHTFHIYDPKHRIISKATVRDRVVHHLIFRELYEISNPTFIFHSYSSRLGKGAHRAVKNLSKILRSVSHNYTQPTFALKCDIKQFFASDPAMAGERGDPVSVCDWIASPAFAGVTFLAMTDAVCRLGMLHRKFSLTYI